MLLTLIASSIFLFLTVTIGNWLSALLARIFKVATQSLFQNLLLGFVFLSCYLNIWSLFLPVNFYALAPVGIFSMLVSKYSAGTIDKIVRVCSQFLSIRFAIIALPVLLVVFVYALLPPQHGDSPGYHFLAIRWNEEYKVVPGLAILHGRLGFNSSFFVSSAAFAFAHIAGQPLYVLNIVFIFCYYLWLLNRVYFNRGSLWGIVFVFVSIAMFRQLIDSISSPTPDVLAAMIISYVFITIAENIVIKNQINEPQTLIMLLLICFAFTVKLNTLPLAGLALFLIIHTRLHERRRALPISIISGCVLLIPWIIRNYFLTGYLVFPVAFTGFFHPDWKVPFEILHFEKLLINNGPKLISRDWEKVDALSFTEWFPKWISGHFSAGLTSSLIILIIAMITTFLSIVLFSKKRHSLLLWLTVINLASIAFWMYNSPDYRFGYPYLLNGIVLLLLFLTKNKPLKWRLQPLTVIIVIIICVYYLKHAISVLSPYPFTSFALKPLQVPATSVNTDLASFPFTELKNRVKLYVEDKDHWCNEAPLPCLIPYSDSFPVSQLQLRGESIIDGFRVIKR